MREGGIKAGEDEDGGRVDGGIEEGMIYRGAETF